jgi:hypothetical protein
MDFEVAPRVASCSAERKAVRFMAPAEFYGVFWKRCPADSPFALFEAKMPAEGGCTVVVIPKIMPTDWIEGSSIEDFWI